DEAAASFAVGDIERLAFPDAVFDVVLCMGVLEYVDADRAIRELVRVTKPGGTLVASMLNAWSPHRLWDRLVYRRALALRRAVRRLPAPAEPALRTYSARGLGRLLRRHRLHTVAVVCVDFTLAPPPLDLGPVPAGLRHRQPQRTSRRGRCAIGVAVGRPGDLGLAGPHPPRVGGPAPRVGRDVDGAARAGAHVDRPGAPPDHGSARRVG